MCFKASYNKVCIGNMFLTFPGWNGLNPIHLKPTAFQFCFILSQVKKKSNLKKNIRNGAHQKLQVYAQDMQVAHKSIDPYYFSWLVTKLGM